MRSSRAQCSPFIPQKLWLSNVLLRRGSTELPLTSRAPAFSVGALLPVLKIAPSESNLDMAAPEAAGECG
jgi:hypothetical protein